MMYAGSMQPPPEQQGGMKFVYIKMTRAQFNNRYGKLRKGDVIIVDEPTAMRWVYRARIAKPSSQDEFEDWSRKTTRSMSGSRIRNQPLALPAQDESPFEYVEEGTPEWDQMAGDDRGEPEPLDTENLGDQLEGVEEDDEDDEGHEVSDDGEGVYDARITRGPGEQTEGPTVGTPPRGRGRGRARSRS